METWITNLSSKNKSTFNKMMQLNSRNAITDYYNNGVYLKQNIDFFPPRS